MSVFTSLITETLTVPGTSASVVIRKLAPKHLAEAQKAAQARAFADMKQTRDWLGDDLLDKLSASATPKEGPADPLLTHDRMTLLERGIVSWTFEQPLGRESYEDLEDDTAEWMATAILKLAKPSLYAAAEAATKNG